MVKISKIHCAFQKTKLEKLLKEHPFKIQYNTIFSKKSKVLI